jgi:hypothetical protein
MCAAELGAVSGAKEMYSIYVEFWLLKHLPGPFALYYDLTCYYSNALGSQNDRLCCHWKSAIEDRECSSRSPGHENVGIRYNLL